MRAVLTRVKSASVTIDGEVTGKIGKGFDVCELYAPNGTAIPSAPHPSMIFWCRVPFEIREGDIMRAGSPKGFDKRRPDSL